MNITIGMGATMSIGSDRYPFTVMQTEQIKGKTYALLQSDSYIRRDKNGLSEEQDWEYTQNPKGRIVYLREKGTGWEEVVKNSQSGRWNKAKSCAHYYVGEREAYQDPSF